MKRAFLILGVVLILASCKEKKQEGFRIEGKISHSHGQVIYLEELTTNDIRPVDTAKIDPNGVFAFSGKITEPKFYLLRIDNDNFIKLLVSNDDKILVTGDAQDLPHTYKIEGTSDSKLLEELHYHLLSTLARIDSLGEVYRKNRDNPELDSISAKLDITYNKVVGEHRKYSIEFVQKNCSSLASILALSQQLEPQNYIFDAKKDLKYFKLVSDTLMTIYPNHTQVKALNSYIQEMQKIVEQHKYIDIGSMAPDISMRNEKELLVALSSLRGKYVLLDFWASWCKPCRAENPNLVKNFAKYHKLGLEIYQVSLDKTAENWKSAIESDNLKWFHVSDFKEWQSPVVKQYNVEAIPSNFLIDPNGKIVAMNLRGADLGKKLAEIYKE